MTDQPSLQFSVEESVWFEKGQEVQELVSMSLDPEIAIQEHDQYLSIRGALQLSGEYYPREDQSEEVSDIESLRENRSVRMVHEVRMTEDGVCELGHKFPVDITIPMSRVDNLDDVYVMVESFDYELPEQGRLQLTAELSISGISGEANRVEESQESEEETVEDNVEPLFKETESVPAQEFPSFETEVRKEPTQEANELEEEEADDVELTNESEQNSDLQARDDEQEDIEVEEVEDHEADEEEAETLINLASRSETESSDNDRAAVKLNEKAKVEDDDYEVSDENALYLTEIFADEGGEHFSTLRMRIIQSGETIDMIANSYDTSISKLMQMNRIDDDHVQEGQIIYVPALER